jgi:hypothetical protein
MTKQNDLKILCSARVRLTPEQRQLLKDAYRQAQHAGSPASMPLVNRGSGIAVENAPVMTDINRQLGLPHIVVLDLLSSREAISLPTVLHLQQVLGVEVVTDKDLKLAFDDYLNYVRGNVHGH